MKVRYPVLLAPLAPLLLFAGLALRDPEALVLRAKGWSDWILDHFDWLFSWSIFGCLVVVVIVYFSPLGRVRIGGEDAQPILSPWRWFAVAVCTTIATGILFWATAEPLYHLTDTPAAGVEDPAVFAMSTLFLHWTFTPYGMYCLPALSFALAYYNRRQPFTVSALLEPVLGPRIHAWGGGIVDAICLFALVAGMASSLGSGTLAIQGGLGVEKTPASLGLILLAVVLTFTVSAASGLQRGIRVLSNVNIIGFIILALFVFLTGPTREALALGGRGLLDYVQHFLPRNLGMDPGIPTQWNHDWTSFYWANWFAWAPITALFLGRLGVGYTVRQFIRVNLVYTSLFGGVWMVIFGAGAIVLGGGADSALALALREQGPEGVIYAMLDQLPLARYTPLLFIPLMFISFVTAADSNISAMSGLCTADVNPEHPEAPLWIKLIWGGVLGVITWLLISFAGIDGVRLVATLGGFPALFLCLLAAVGLLRLVFHNHSLRVPLGSKSK